MGNANTKHANAGEARARSRSATAPSMDEDTLCDGGCFAPLSNIYPTSPQDWSKPVVYRLIADRKIAPFYRGLEDWDEDCDPDEIADALDKVGDDKARSFRANKSSADRTAENKLYKLTSECPICFLYYPPYINHSRCCDQPICTECFVQIRRADISPTHLESEPAACPYCQETNFGVTYVGPPVSRRTGYGAANGRPKAEHASSSDSAAADDDDPGLSSFSSRRKSVHHTAPEVVLVDAIHPDWEEKVAVVKAQVARRANRRIVFRQVGDRLIPVGVTSGRDQQGNVVAGQPTIVTGDESTSSGRRRRRHEVSSFLSSVAGGGPDLEELMIMEAMRLSLLEEEERQRKEKEAKAKAANSSSPKDHTAESSRAAEQRQLSPSTSHANANSILSASPPADTGRTAPSPVITSTASPQQNGKKSPKASSPSTPTKRFSNLFNKHRAGDISPTLAPVNVTSTNYPSMHSGMSPSTSTSGLGLSTSPLSVIPSSSSTISSVSNNSAAIPLSQGYQPLPDED